MADLTQVNDVVQLEAANEKYLKEKLEKQKVYNVMSMNSTMTTLIFLVLYTVLIHASIHAVVSLPRSEGTFL